MRRRRLLLAALAGTAALGLAELALRWCLDADGLLFGRPLPPFAAVNHPNQRNWLREREGDGASRERFIRFDAELGWEVVPGRRGDAGHPERNSNALGARGAREYPAAPPPGTLRVLCFGDSFTFCNDAPDRDAWPAQMEALDPAVEAVNFGVSAYGVDQALLRFRRRGRALGAHAVAIGLMLENIGRHVNRYRPLYYPSAAMPYTKPRFLLQGDRLALLPQPFATEAELVAAMTDGSVVERVREGEYWHDGPVPLGALCTARLLAGYFSHSRRQWRNLWQEPDGEPFRVTVTLLETFRSEALAAGARAAPVLLFPAEKDLEALAAGTAPYWRGLTEALAAKGIECVDLSAPLHAALAGRPAGALFAGGHLQREGNGIVARAVLDWLRSRLK